MRALLGRTPLEAAAGAASTSDRGSGGGGGDYGSDDEDADDSEGDRKAELLGSALGLNILKLYQQQACECVCRGDLRRARCLFQLSGATPLEVVSACLSMGRGDSALEEVAEMISTGGAGAAVGPGRLSPEVIRRLRLACLTHLQLSAWAAAAAAAALENVPPEAARAAALAASAATAGTQQGIMAPNTAVVAAASVINALQGSGGAGGGARAGAGAHGMSEEELAGVVTAAASACTAANGAAAIAAAMESRDPDDESGQTAAGGHMGSAPGGPGDAASAQRRMQGGAEMAEAMLRLMLAVGRTVEVLHAQGVVLGEGGGAPWLSGALQGEADAVFPSLPASVGGPQHPSRAAGTSLASLPRGALTADAESRLVGQLLPLLTDRELIEVVANSARGSRLMAGHAGDGISEGGGVGEAQVRTTAPGHVAGCKQRAHRAANLLSFSGSQARQSGVRLPTSPCLPHSSLLYAGAHHRVARTVLSSSPWRCCGRPEGGGGRAGRALGEIPPMAGRGPGCSVGKRRRARLHPQATPARQLREADIFLEENTLLPAFLVTR